MLGKLCSPEMLLYFQTFLTAFKTIPTLFAPFDENKFNVWCELCVLFDPTQSGASFFLGGASKVHCIGGSRALSAVLGLWPSIGPPTGNSRPAALNPRHCPLLLMPSIHISVGGRQKYPLITVSLCGTLYYHFPGILFKFVQLVRREQPRVPGTGRLDLPPEEHLRARRRERG